MRQALRAWRWRIGRGLRPAAWQNSAFRSLLTAHRPLRDGAGQGNHAPPELEKVGVLSDAIVATSVFLPASER